MTRWQRRVRLLVAVFVIGFAVALTFAFKRRATMSPPADAGLSDPNAVVESTSGQSFKFKGTREDVRVDYDHQLTYKDGSTKLLGVTIVTVERGGARSFTVTAKEGFVGQNESSIDVNGDVKLMASDGLIMKSEHATYSDGDGTVRVPGPIEFVRNRMSGTGVGMTYDKNQDVLVILDQAHIQVASTEEGQRTDITSPTATVARRDHVVRFERGVNAVRSGHVIQADNGVAHLTEDDERLQMLELRGGSKITSSKAQAGGLQSLTGRDMDVKYGPDGETLEHVIVTGDAATELAGNGESAGRRITANVMDIALAPDGTTPVGVVGRDGVTLTFPAEQGSAGRTIKAISLDAHGEADRGLTNALFTGAASPACLDRRTAGAECDVDYREQGAGPGRTAKAAALEVTLKAGMSAIDEAKFSKNVRFEDGKLTALAALGRYVLDKGTLALSAGDVPGPPPHIVNEQITIDAARIDVVLAGPKMNASGSVRSVLQPKSKDPKSDTKTPSMLKGDQVVNIVSDELEYDGSQSKATYRGHTKLWQVDTSITAQTLTLDNKNGDISASGTVATSAMLEHRTKDKQKERVRSIGTAQEFKYEESMRRATYSAEAHLSGPQGDMTADKIELYLEASGDEVDRAEAYTKVTLREQERKTTGDRLTYTSADDRYLVTGGPLTIVDACGRETIGRKLTFLAGSETVIIESGGQSRTQTKTTGKCS